MCDLEITRNCFLHSSQDFIVANHYLEHCENLLGTLRSHLDRVKPGGLLFYTVPDRRMTFDWRRANTPFAHLVADDQGGAASARLEHYREWAQLVMGVEGEAIDKTAGRLMNRNESIHYHCWDKQSLRALFDAARSYLDDRFVILERHANGPEMVVVLRRIG